MLMLKQKGSFSDAAIGKELQCLPVQTGDWHLSPCTIPYEDFTRYALVPSRNWRNTRPASSACSHAE